jgi:FkbM family methyltransferase
VTNSCKIYLFNHLPLKLLILYINLNKNYNIRIKKIHKYLYSVKSSPIELFVTRRWRFFKYKLGIEKRMSELREKYFIDDIIFNENDLVIDIGSNIGELPVSIRLLGNKIRVIAIEPDPIEFACLKLNLNENDIVLCCFLGANIINAYAKFNNKTGDTHVITTDHDANQNSHHALVKVFTLDELFKSNQLGIIKLMKIETEGYEPEVLSGSQELLRQTKYVTIDTGLERGNKDTFDECHLFLENIGFKMIKNNDRKSALFINYEL